MKSLWTAALLASLLPAQNPRTASTPTRILVGKVTGAQGGHSVLVRCFKLRTGRDGGAVPLSKHEFFHTAPCQEVLAEDGVFEIMDLPPGHYSLVAFEDLDGDGKLGYDPPEPLGWYASEPAGGIAPIDVRQESKELAFALRRPTPLPKALEHRHAALLRLRGVPVVRLHGTAVERGTAHGALLARQILDWFEFYLLEDRFRSARTYQQEFVPFLEHNFRWPVAMVQEVDAVLAGMKGSGVPLRVAALARDFNRTDLLAINAYVETRAMRSACTQFAVWGAQTAGTDVAGGLIAGRNMDGEVDLRKTTVMHTLVFAVEQRAPGKHRFASVMWPGFVGTLSGISEDGLYSMENASGSGRGPVENALVPISWTQRFILENVTASVTPDAIARLFDAHRSSGGGACGPGCIVFFAQPFRGQRAPAFVYEGDRFGGVMRLPGEVRPSAQTCLMASNHPLKYRAGTGVPVPSFSSRWRYEAGKNLLETWTRQRRPIGTTEMVRLLQSACHGTTEHSVIFRANQKTIDLAIDDLKADMWDAPYLAWQRFAFAELFRPK